MFIVYGVLQTFLKFQTQNSNKRRNSANGKPCYMAAFFGFPGHFTVLLHCFVQVINICKRIIKIFFSQTAATKDNFPHQFKHDNLADIQYLK